MDFQDNLRCIQFAVFVCLFGSGLGQACDFTITSSSGNITSPMYPQAYPAGLDCTWRFQAPFDRVIEVTFNHINMEEENIFGDCQDSVMVDDGSIPSTPFCGEGPFWPSSPQRYISLSNEMTITMQSNNVDSGHTGFHARYRHVPSREEHVVAMGVDPPTIVRIDRFRVRGIQPIPVSAARRPSAIGYDPIRRHFYYTDIQLPWIARVGEDGTGHEVLVDQGIITPLGLVVGYLTGLLYWTDVGRHEVSVSRLDGRFRKTLVPANTGCISPRGIELSYDQQYVVWTCSNLIEKSKADGTGRRVLVRDIFEVKSIAVDHERDLIFWTDLNTGTIEVVDFDGNNRISIADHGVFRLTHGFVVEAGVLFWSEPAEKRVLFVDLNRSNASIRYVRQGEGNIMEGLYYYRSDRVLPEEHACSENKCNQLCFPEGPGYCEDVTPVIVGCPEDIAMATATSQTSVSWTEPRARSRSNGETQVNIPYDSRSNPPGSLFFWGNSTVRYHFVDDLGNEADCTFKVVLTRFVPTTTTTTTTVATTTTVRLPTTDSPSTVATTKAAGTDQTLSGDLLPYTVIGISVIALILITITIVCIACCCGCWKCTCRPKGRDPVVSQFGMTNMQGTPNAGYMQPVSQRPLPPPYGVPGTPQGGFNGGAPPPDGGFYSQGVYDPAQNNKSYMDLNPNRQF